MLNRLLALKQLRADQHRVPVDSLCLVPDVECPHRNDEEVDTEERGEPWRVGILFRFVSFRLTVSQEQTGTFHALNRVHVHAWQLASKRRKHVNSHLIECERAAGPEHRNDDVESELVFDHARRCVQENTSVRTLSVRKLLIFSASITKRESEMMGNSLPLPQ